MMEHPIRDAQAQRKAFACAFGTDECGQRFHWVSWAARVRQMIALLMIFGMTLVFGVYAVALVVGLWRTARHYYVGHNT